MNQVINDRYVKFISKLVRLVLGAFISSVLFAVDSEENIYKSDAVHDYLLCLLTKPLNCRKHSRKLSKC